MNILTNTMKILTYIKLKRSLSTVLIYALLTSTTSAITEQELKILEASENIEYVSQSIAKAYFYKHLGIRVSHADKDLTLGMSNLIRDIKVITTGSGDIEERNVLQFISVTHDEMAKTLASSYSLENGSLMMDYSESLLEGAELIASKHFDKKDQGVVSLVVVERMKFLLERINKYYIAFRAGLNDQNNVVQLERAVREFETDLEVVNAYANYPVAIQSSVDKINKFWPIAKRFYLGIEKSSLPVIVMASTENLEVELTRVESYFHSLLVDN